jgi:hypothetical protein
MGRGMEVSGGGCQPRLYRRCSALLFCIVSSTTEYYSQPASYSAALISAPACPSRRRAEGSPLGQPGEAPTAYASPASPRVRAAENSIVNLGAVGRDSASQTIGRLGEVVARGGVVLHVAVVGLAVAEGTNIQEYSCSHGSPAVQYAQANLRPVARPRAGVDCRCVVVACLG